MAYQQSNNAGAFNWLFQRISGILIAVVLVIHLGAVHFGASPVDLGSPFWKVLPSGFVILLLYHILNGFWLTGRGLCENQLGPGVPFRVGLGRGFAFLILGFVTLVPFGS